MNNKKILIILIILLALLVAIFSGIYIITRPQTNKADKVISVTVVFADKSEKQYKIHTKAEYLADALLERKIIKEKSKDGMYTVIAGERADYNLDKSWWLLSVNGKTANLGINDQPLTDGDSFEITNTPS